jgi:hypothetical protein
MHVSRLRSTLPIAVVFLFILGAGCSDSAKTPKLSSIDITPGEATLPLGRTQALTATGHYSDGSSQNLTAAATWSSSNAADVNVSNLAGHQGEAQALAKGQITVTATYQNVTGTTDLTVTSAALDSILITTKSATVPKGFQQQYTAIGMYSDGNTVDITAMVTWSSSAEGIVTVSNDAASPGLATAVDLGDATLAASLSGVTGMQMVQVTNATLSSVQVSANSLSLPKGLSENFVATAVFSDASKLDVTSMVTWMSSTPADATVDSSGKVTSVQKGMSTISATFQGTTGSAKTGSAVVTVTDAIITTIMVVSSRSSIAKGETQQFTAKGVYSDNSAPVDISSLVTWASSDSSKLSISTSGLGTGLDVTATDVTVSATYMSVTGSLSFEVDAHRLTGIVIDPFNPPLPIGNTHQFTLEAVYTDGTQPLPPEAQIMWGADGTVAMISTGGLVTGLKKGNSNITAMYMGFSAMTMLDVTDATLLSISIDTPAMTTLAKGQTENLTVTAQYSDGPHPVNSNLVLWATSDGSVLSVDNTMNPGQVTALAQGAQPVTIIASFSSKTAQVDISVSAAALVAVHVSPGTVSLAKGLTQTFTVTADYTDGLGKPVDINMVTFMSGDNSKVQLVTGMPGEVLAKNVTTSAVNVLVMFGNKSDMAAVTVTPHQLQSVKVSFTDLTGTPANLVVGGTEQMVMTATFTDGPSDVTSATTWTTDQPTMNPGFIINASMGGNPVTGLVKGDIIGATGHVSGTFMSMSDMVALDIVDKKVMSVTISPATVGNLPFGVGQQFNAVAHYQDGTVATVTDQATFTLAPGSGGTGTDGVVVHNDNGAQGLLEVPVAGVMNAVPYQLTASFQGVTSAVTSISVVDHPLTGLALQTTGDGRIPKGIALEYDVIATFGSANYNVTRESMLQPVDPTIATVDSQITNAGIVHAVGLGMTSVTAMFRGMPTSVMVTVVDFSLQSISLMQVTGNNPAPVDSLLEFQATGTFVDNSNPANMLMLNVDQSAMFGVSNGAICSVSNAVFIPFRGAVRGDGLGMTNVTATIGSVVGMTTLTFQ